jgi:branched-chain amino acid transport system ATP-binding protein
MLGNQIERLKKERFTILLTEQNALFAMDISDRAYIIDKGSIVYKGSVKELSEDRETMREYLGV